MQQSLLTPTPLAALWSRRAVRSCAPRLAGSTMNERHPERLRRANRLRAARDFAALKASGTAFRSPPCVLVVLPCPGELTRIGYVASKRSVGNSPQRNRARRRLREIVRRRWPRVRATGFLLLLIATRHTLEASHQALASDVERLLAGAGALRPIPVREL